MTPLTSILAAAVAGGVLSTVAAAGTLALHAGWISRLVSFAVGALLGAVFLELLPHALEDGSADRVMVTVLAGLLAFFLLEKLVLWRHAHGHEEHRDDEDESEHDHALHAHADADQGRSGLMILIGNCRAQFLRRRRHRRGVPRRIRASASPRRSRSSRMRCRSRSATSPCSSIPVSRARARSRSTSPPASPRVAGALAGYFALAGMQQMLPTVLAIAAASLLYVAVADLIPSLHRRAGAGRNRQADAGDRPGRGDHRGVHVVLPH